MSTKLSNNVTLPVTKATNENEGTPADQRVVGTVELVDGPRINPETKSYLPAAYIVAPGITRIDR
jgi:hypothetical protein